MIRFTIYLILYLALIQCIPKPVNPDGVDSGDTETSLINSAFRAEAVTGTYRIVQALYYKDDLMDFSEGQYTYGEPDPTYMKSQYTLQLSTTPTKDSLIVVLSGTGYLGAFDNFTLPALGLTADTGLEPNGAGYTYTELAFGNKDDKRLLIVARRAFKDKTNLLVAFTLGKYHQANGVLTGSPMYYPRLQALERSIFHWVSFTGTRSSTGILKIAN